MLPVETAATSLNRPTDRAASTSATANRWSLQPPAQSHSHTAHRTQRHAVSAVCRDRLDRVETRHLRKSLITGDAEYQDFPLPSQTVSSTFNARPRQPPAAIAATSPRPLTCTGVDQCSHPGPLLHGNPRSVPIARRCHRASAPGFETARGDRHHPVSPLTCTGSDPPVAMLLPNCPMVFDPHAQTFVTLQRKIVLVARCDRHDAAEPLTSPGTHRSARVPSPNWPA